MTPADLDQAPGRWRGDIEGRGPDQYFDQPLPLPDTLPARGKPVAHDDRRVRTGSQVGQDHCRLAHGEPRHVCVLIVDFEAVNPPKRNGLPLPSASRLAWPILFGQTDLKGSEPPSGRLRSRAPGHGPNWLARNQFEHDVGIT